MRRATKAELVAPYSVLAGFMLAGAIFVLVGLPVSYGAAVLAGKDPVSSILLTHSSEYFSSFVTHRSLAQVTYSEISAISGAFALLGSLVTALPLVFQIIKRGGFIRFLSLMYGLLLGLGLTRAWFEWSSTGRIGLFEPNAMETGYIYVAFFFSESAKLVIEDKGIIAVPYNYAIDGLFGTVVVLIISVGYDTTFASLLLGPFFLLAVALAIFSAEWLFLRPGTILVLALGSMIMDQSFAGGTQVSDVPPRVPLRSALSHLRVRIGEAAALTYPRRVKRIESVASKIKALLPRQRKGRRSIKIHWGIACAVCAFQVLFLTLAVFLAWLIF